MKRSRTCMQIQELEVPKRTRSSPNFRTLHQQNDGAKQPDEHPLSPVCHSASSEGASSEQVNAEYVPLKTSPDRNTGGMDTPVRREHRATWGCSAELWPGASAAPRTSLRSHWSLNSLSIPEHPLDGYDCEEEEEGGAPQGWGGLESRWLKPMETPDPADGDEDVGWCIDSVEDSWSSDSPQPHAQSPPWGTPQGSAAPSVLACSVLAPSAVAATAVPATTLKPLLLQAGAPVSLSPQYAVGGVPPEQLPGALVGDGVAVQTLASAASVTATATATVAAVAATAHVSQALADNYLAILQLESLHLGQDVCKPANTPPPRVLCTSAY